MDKVLIHHRGLDRTVAVPAGVAPAWCAEGWELASGAEAETVANAHVSAEDELAAAQAASAEATSVAVATIRIAAGAPAEPPRHGTGSGVAAWQAYADSIGVAVAEDATRDDIIAAVDANKTATAGAVETATTTKENNS